MESKTFPGTLDSLDLIRQHVKELSQQAGLDKKSTYNLMLAADEIATNIILYGYEQAGQTGSIDVLSEIADNQLKVVFEDEAKPFDPTARDLPTEDDFNKPLEERTIGGMGIFLTINGVDKFSYEYANNRNRNIFIMNVDHVHP
ncbi:anti-sigma regulatory factor [Nibrella viscosa]|uniref:Anti-sigma regulatory factor n=1 Tax=Nibrella viscosa TaxID=1084524 RepID=A0ABP8KR09_9BACT